MDTVVDVHLLNNEVTAAMEMACGECKNCD